MVGEAAATERWRRFFRDAGADIFEVIEQAIHVAASDRPEELRARRDRIAEQLFTLTRAEPRDDAGVEEGDGSVRREAGEKESKMGSSSNHEPDSELNRIVSNYSYDEAEALTEEIEEESQIVGEVFRIKEVLTNWKDESDSVLFESLRRLQLMSLSVETLRATEIGRAVNGLRKHNSKQIRLLVRTLIDGWKVLVDEWVSTTEAIADHSPDSVNPSSTVDYEEGLPSPPMDEGALLATQTTSIQLSEFFDCMDDDGNPRTGMQSDRMREVRRSMDNPQPVRKQQCPGRSTIPEGNVQARTQEQVVRQTKPQEAVNGLVKSQDIWNKSSKPSVADFGPGRPPRPALEQKASTVMKCHQQRGPSTIQRKPHTAQPDNCTDDGSVRAKLEAAKRKLHERYQEAENAKKQRTIQVMELQDIPKRANNFRQSNVKPKSNLRNWANGRR